MSVKVVQGLIGDARAKPFSNSNQQNIATSNAQTGVVLQNLASSEAVNVAVRSQRTNTNGEKIREYKEAKEVADKTADRIRKDESSPDAHSGLNSANSTAALA